MSHVHVHDDQATEPLTAHAAPQTRLQTFQPMKVRSAVQLVTGRLIPRSHFCGFDLAKKHLYSLSA